MKKCKGCDKEISDERKFCSNVCYYEWRRGRGIKVKQCLRCGKDFTLHNRWYWDVQVYCSHQCKNAKYKINQEYFKDEIDDEALGILICSADVLTDGKTIQVKTNEETLQYFLDKLDSDYPIFNGERGLKRSNIISIPLVNDLLDIGFEPNILHREVIGVNLDNVFKGMLKTHCYSFEEGVHMFRCISSKVALWVKSYVNGRIDTVLYKDKHKHTLGCEWVVRWIK